MRLESGSDEASALLDMRPVLKFWDEVASRRGTSRATDLWREDLGEGVYAALAPRPWQAMTLAHFMREREMTGLIESTSHTGKILLKDASWESWWKALASMEPWLPELTPKRSHASSLNQLRHRLAKAFPALGIKRPSDAAHLTPDSMRRRFGPIAQILWEWAFSRDTHVMEAHPFPWHEWAPRPTPKVPRVLDTPLCQWDPLEGLLLEDLDRLAREALSSEGTHAHERVTRLTWELVIDAPSTRGRRAICETPILFRHPHDLGREIGSHTTALTQARLAFEAAASRFQPPDRQDVTMDRFTALGWTLVLSESLRLPARLSALFHDTAEREATSLAALLSLENQTRVPLERVDVLPDWSVDDAWHLFDAGESRPHEALIHDDSLARPWMRAFETRPLFTHLTPVPLTAAPSRPTRFLERVMQKWWDTPDTLPALGGDFHSAKLPQGRYESLRWLYHDTLTNQWIDHGIFS
jgi:hypothetical protein